MRRTERAAYRTKFYSNLSSPTQFDEEPISTINGSTALTYPYVLQGIFFYTLLMLSQYGTIVIACSNSSCKCCV